MSENTTPATEAIADMLRDAFATTAERTSAIELQTGGAARASFDVVIRGERYRVSVARNPLLDIELDADGVPRATRALKPDEEATVSLAAALEAIYRNRRGVQ